MNEHYCAKASRSLTLMLHSMISLLGVVPEKLPVFRVTGAAGAPVLMALLLLSGCQDSSDTTFQRDIAAARAACVAATDYNSQLCMQQCSRSGNANEFSACAMLCTTQASAASALCEAPLRQFENPCVDNSCTINVDECRTEATADYSQCSNSCTANNLRCASLCLEGRAVDEQHCGFLPTEIASGSIAVPLFEPGKPAFLPGLLDEAEIAVVEAADERAVELRSRTINLWTGQAATKVSITQVEHDFAFGVPLDIREFEEADDNLAFYGEIARKHTSLLVAETSLKWRNVERNEEEFQFDLADRELAWAEQQGFDVKAHVLMWGNDPPLASGSGTPEWLRNKFPNENLTPEEVQELSALIREHVMRVVGRYSGRIDVWEVTNEMLNPITDWFAVRLGPDIVNDIFRWAREADPGAQLVYNEWINEIFTGLGGPDSYAVRDRIQALLQAGVPIDALGQQGHFAPGLVNIGIDVDLSQRTRVDDYARALDTLAETGLPIHITEVTFTAPEEPEHRAAQAEAIMRLWWGHPQVEEIIFWNFWNPLGPRSHLNLGLYNDDRNLSRHGEAILSLLNERWRTQVEGVSNNNGKLALRATHGAYIAQWSTPQGPVHVRFYVEPGPDDLNIVAVEF